MIFLIFLTLIHSYSKLSLKNPTDRLCIILKITILALLLLEIASVIHANETSPSNITIHKLITVVGLALSPFPIYICYIIFNKFVFKNKFISRKTIYFLSIPLIINLLFSVFDYFNKVFSVTPTGVSDFSHQRFIVSFLITSVYYVLSILFIIKNIKKLNRDEMVTFCLIIVISLTFGLFQLLNVFYLTLWSGWAIISIMIYLFLLNDKLVSDPLTSLGNKNAYYSFLNKIRSKQNLKLTIVNIDLDEFKKVNDNFGHIEGDYVLKLFAFFIMDSFDKYSKAIRFGGDEFIIFIEDDNLELIHTYIQKLKENTDRFNEKNSKAYSINFSYGIAILNKDSKSIDELLKLADEKMYLYKKKNSNKFK